MWLRFQVFDSNLDAKNVTRSPQPSTIQSSVWSTSHDMCSWYSSHLLYLLQPWCHDQPFNGELKRWCTWQLLGNFHNPMLRPLGDVLLRRSPQLGQRYSKTHWLHNENPFLCTATCFFHMFYKLYISIYNITLLPCVQTWHILPPAEPLLANWDFVFFQQHSQNLICHWWQKHVL